jgi:hypothetical protein
MAIGVGAWDERDIETRCDDGNSVDGTLLLGV